MAKTGDNIVSGCVNTSGQLKIRVEKILEESMVTRILDSVENAAASKPNIDKFITRFARVYTPFVVFFALFVAIVLPFILPDSLNWHLFVDSAYTGTVNTIHGTSGTASIYTALTFLVISCPCALVLSVPLAFFSGIGAGSKKGILFKGGIAIEGLKNVKAIVMDKTGTITLGNRQASAFIPVDGVTSEELADAAQLASLADETPEGRSIVVLAKEQFNLRGRSINQMHMEFVPFSAKTRMSGVNYQGNEIRKGAADTIKKYVTENGHIYSDECEKVVTEIANLGGTPLVVTKNKKVLGVIHLKDIIKQGVKEKFADLRKMGIKTVMITGDNPLTAAAIAAEAGVDDFLAEATPEGKLEMIRELQAKGHLVAMTGDGTNDAPALAQADVAVAMNTGTQAAKEAGNMVDLDSSPTKLIDIVRIGKQLLMTRGSLTTFSIANDVAKYFAIIPVLFITLYPGLDALNIMGLHSKDSAIFSAIIYNALIIIALIPLALKGVKYREVSAGKLLSRNLLVYGLGGIIAPFICIKIIDVIIVALHIVS